MRLRTQNKRDQRVVDTWKKDMEQPSVQDILQNYVMSRPPNQVAEMLMDEEA